MKNLAFAAFAAVLFATSPAFAQQIADLTGVWLRDDGNARIKIAPCGSAICATNMWIGDTSQGEEPGDRLVMSLEPQPAGTLAGTAYDKKRDRTYTITLKLADDSLVTRGCVLGGILCRDVGWTPVN